MGRKSLLVEGLDALNEIREFGGRHGAKQEAAERGVSLGDFHAVGQATPITKKETFKDYLDITALFANYCKGEGIKTFQQVHEGDLAANFLVSKVNEGCAWNTIDKYASGLEKLSAGLEAKFSEKFDWHKDISEVKEGIKEYFKENGNFELASRAYAPDELQSVKEGLQERGNVRDELIYDVLKESGCRGSEACNITSEQLGGIKTYMGEEVGCINVIGKGDKPNELHISLESYSRLESYLESKGDGEKLGNLDNFRDVFKDICNKVGVDYDGGVHGIRHSWCQNRMEELQDKYGMTFQQALKQCSFEMSHERSEITKIYLR